VASARAFSSTPCRRKMSRQRIRMFEWLNNRQGSEFAQSGDGPKYLGPLPDQPFPNNPLFRSQPVLDDATRELIWNKVVQQGQSLKAVSAEMGVDVRRTAAVVRLKEVQRQWEKDGKKLATPYAKAVMNMLPKTSFREGEENAPHEPTNDVHVHALTMPQLFVPVSESRHYTREDAAKAFHDKLLSVDARSPQPELIAMEREIADGADRKTSMEKFREVTQEQEDEVAQRHEEYLERKERRMTRVRTDRYEFRFNEVNSERVGQHGRSRKAVGWRYGAPLDDRKRGQVKIPTSVP